MVKSHFHDEIGTGEGHLNEWSADRMTRHLREVHNMTVPMVWDLGRLHQAHLEDHQGAPEQEDGIDHSPKRFPIGKAAMLICGHPQPGHPTIVCTEQPGHKPVPGKDPVDGSYWRHADREQNSFWGPVPVDTNTHDHGGSVEDFHSNTDRRSVAYHLYGSHDLPQDAIDTREVYSQHAGLHQPTNVKEQPVPTIHEHDAEIPRSPELYRHLSEKHGISLGSGDELRDDPVDIHRKAHGEPITLDGERQILIDRIICVMTGIAFDSVWVRDESLSLRGVMRSTHGTQAGRLLAWVDRGGVLEIPKIRELARDLEREQSLVHDLEETNNGLRQQLESAQSQLRGAEDTLEEVRGELDQRVRERDDARRHAEAIFEEMGELRQQQDEGRAQLRALVSELERDGWNASSVFQRLLSILGESVSTTGEPIKVQDQPSLGLATTRQLLEEITTRIDVGHCGLDFRTVDHHE